jgi:hypothetical protein
MHAAALDQRQQQFEFAMPNERIAAHQRYVQRFALVDERKHPADKLISLEVGEFAEWCPAPEMCCIKGITSSAPQWAFFRNFD